MNFISWLISRVTQFFSGGGDARRSSSAAGEGEVRGQESRNQSRGRNFDDDYRAATNILKTRMSNRFPDNYHARMGSEKNNARDFGDERAEAIDTASAVIATALRDGATVKQAADAGAASVGI
ncbi:hypothetical protein AO398_09395 [Methylobacterium sp. GXS13]|uniref:hypothetical protein n=1 Tax=Methylobacterium sp. GXS13 TaxID=1730094 RepID=UPI00071C1074|nr:hypothetical protein [Methylobacterium sp. GXS13]KST56786.1 hypothetical protein AO398_09395 [Methylobacterium sp. GXS13]